MPYLDYKRFVIWMIKNDLRCYLKRTSQINTLKVLYTLSYRNESKIVIGILLDFNINISVNVHILISKEIL